MTSTTTIGATSSSGEVIKSVTSSPRHLRVGTYLCPSLPVELFQLLSEFLEEDLGCETTLMYEWRSTGPLPNRVDPFLSNTLDLAFVSVPAYQHMLKENKTGGELLPVGAVFKHARNTEHVAGYYSDIIIHSDGTYIKEFLDLRGCTWAYSNEESLSGSTVVLQKLKQAGERANFFGNKLKAGSHLHAVQMVRSKQADAAAVDANTLAQLKRQVVGDGELEDIKVLTSIGPLPPYPILVNSKLPVEVKQQLASSLLAMASRPGWGERLQVFGVERFVSSGPDTYRSYHDILASIKGMTLGFRYY